jgi:hypothetical protein
MEMSRKSFLSRGALAVAGAAVMTGFEAKAEPAPAAAAKAPPPPPPPSAVHFPVLKPTEFEQKKVLDALKVKKEHKVVYQSVEPHVIVPGLASLYVHLQNSLNAGEVSHGYGKGNMATAAVLMGPSVVLALNDAMWARYGFGAAFKINDAKGKPEVANVFYKAQTPMGFDGDPGAGGNVYQDWSGEACLKRGTTFMVCHNAMAAIAGMIGSGMGADPLTVLTEWKANMVPGYMIVPAGVGALNLAMENGWKLLPLI